MKIICDHLIPFICPAHPDCYDEKVCPFPKGDGVSLQKAEIWIQKVSGKTYRDVSSNAIKFAEACVDRNRITELCPFSEYWETDIRTWNITHGEWMWAVASAQIALIADTGIMSDGQISL